MAAVHVVKVVELFFNNKNLPFFRWSANGGAKILDEMFRSENISGRTFDLVDFVFISYEFGYDNFCRNVIKVPGLTRDNHDHRGYIRLIMK